VVFATATLALVVRAAVGTPDGASFTASGKTRFGRAWHVRVSLTGTLAADSASGTARIRVQGCLHLPVGLRATSAPTAPSAGASAT